MNILTTEGMLDLNHIPMHAMTAEVLGNTLAKINRFAGRTPEPWSVAAHSVLVARLCEGHRVSAWGAFHDAHEAFIGDIITPAVSFIASQSQPMGAQIVQNCVRQAKQAIDLQVRKAWNICWDDELQAHVDQADKLALQAEMLWFFGTRPAEGISAELAHAHDIMREINPANTWQTMARLWREEAERLVFLAGTPITQHINPNAA
ncbi:hypothetical protein [Epibacterium ulvae]|uniref:hypothetical protein n=1 Tax=Epibacterium ulvae TaxID=1156985 RepID=UPI0024928650|nr:hypothetical protein [Epibacterium ulvae]